MIEIFIPGSPPTATAQQKGQNRRTGVYYKPPKLKEAEAWYMAGLAKDRPEKPLEGGLALMIQFGFPATKQHPHGEPKTTRPDTDNMVKLLKDCLTRSGYWKDDAQVAFEEVTKMYQRIPGVYIMVMSWAEKMYL